MITSSWPTADRFASRAADVLMRFAARDNNRVIVTSNLVDGELVPRLLRLAGIGARLRNCATTPENVRSQTRLRYCRTV